MLKGRKTKIKPKPSLLMHMIGIMSLPNMNTEAVMKLTSRVGAKVIATADTDRCSTNECMNGWKLDFFVAPALAWAT